MSREQFRVWEVAESCGRGRLNGGTGDKRRKSPQGKNTAPDEDFWQYEEDHKNRAETPLLPQRSLIITPFWMNAQALISEQRYWHRATGVVAFHLTSCLDVSGQVT